MVRLERLRQEHAEALLAFERENRAYFARTVPDRGDDFFRPAVFAARLRDLLTEQDLGICHFHVLLDAEGLLVGRMNLMDAEGGSAELGYRVGQSAAGRGVATAAVGQLCRLAAGSYGLSALTAVTTQANPASRTVLERNGFTRTGEPEVAGRPGVAYRRVLERRPPGP
ncbi:GNAT family N-acetyltransferase [Streptomyces sp. NPDC058867]|uniref:GNAT family N-acetyltransferase n=1 Tax=unclassified Streptomyces TaxID=2593676 RepID=UPI00368DCC35